jgi:hypothetical protein
VGRWAAARSWAAPHGQSGGGVPDDGVRDEESRRC